MIAATNADMVQLILPVNAKAMRIIRLTAAGVMANAGLTIDKTEDLKLAVEEACNCMIQHSACEALRLTFSSNEEDIAIEVEGTDFTKKPGAYIDKTEMKIIECILGSMVDGFAVFHEEGMPCRIMLTVKRNT